MPEEFVPDFPPEPQQQETMPHYDAALAQAKTIESGYGLGVAPHRPTITELLTMKKRELLYQLQQVDEALAEAKKNQGTMDLIDAIAKTGVSARL
jgi:hypothetical protein